MRVINAKQYQFELFENTDLFSYAILSQTWREDEVLYADFLNRTGQDKKGWRKIEYLCRQALKDNITYVWIDTACIDKSSSAELSEAINSMYDWYQQSHICYVYVDDADAIKEIAKSRWITRGWTLQELIAPQAVSFYDQNWNYFGDKQSLAYDLATWTGIEQVVLLDKRYLHSMSIANKLSWAAFRQTSRIEDQAYCLLGIFDVNMPLLYGEGEKAFMRLQEEILRTSNDHSILAGNELWLGAKHGYLATSARDFAYRDIIQANHYDSSLEVTKAGLKINLQLLDFRERSHESCIALLNCRMKGDMQNLVAIEIIFVKKGTHSVWVRTSTHGIKIKAVGGLKKAVMREVIISKETYNADHVLTTQTLQPRFSLCQVKMNPKDSFITSCHLEQGKIGFFNAITMTSEVCILDWTTLRTFFFHHSETKEAFVIQFSDVSLPAQDWGNDYWAYLAAGVKPHGKIFTKWRQECLDGPPVNTLWTTNTLPSLRNLTSYRWKPQQRFQCTIKPNEHSYIEAIKILVYTYTPFGDIVIWRLEVDITTRRLIGNGSYSRLVRQMNDDQQRSQEVETAI